MKAHKWVIVLAVLLFLSLISGGITAFRANQQGYADGHANGYSQGQHDGNKQGHDQGYQDGYNQGQTSGYSSGYDAGKQANNTSDLATMEDWVVNACTKYSNGYYQIVMWKDSNSVIHYNCLVG